MNAPSQTETVRHSGQWRETHHVRLIHFDGHLAEGVCSPVDHLQEAGTAQSLGVVSPGHLQHTHTP